MSNNLPEEPALTPTSALMVLLYWFPTRHPGGPESHVPVMWEPCVAFPFNSHAFASKGTATRD